MRLIINADDFGLTPGVTYGIYDAMRRGAVTSTTMMVNMDAAGLAAELVSGLPSLPVGLHINIGLGRPLTDCESLLRDGRFQKPAVLSSDESYREEDLEMEMGAQYERFLQLVGRRPTHLDSHLYAHQRFKKVRRAMIRLADTHRLPIREYETAQHGAVVFEGGFKVKEGEGPSELEARFRRLVRGLDGVDMAELMVHPGFADAALLEGSSYNLQRVQEHRVLTDPETLRFLKGQSVELVSFKDCEG